MEFPREYWEESTATQKVSELSGTSHGHADPRAEAQWAWEEMCINLFISRLSDLVA